MTCEPGGARRRSGGSTPPPARPSAGSESGWRASRWSRPAYDGLSLRGTRFAVVAAVFGLLVWCFMLRPRVVLGPAEVELRNAFSSWHVPLAGIRRVMVRAITRLDTDAGAFDGVAVGRPLRTLTRRPPPAPKVGLPGLGPELRPWRRVASRRDSAETSLDANALADFMVERVLEAAERARERGEPVGTPRRSWARLELGGLVVLTVAWWSPSWCDQRVGTSASGPAPVVRA